MSSLKEIFDRVLFEQIDQTLKISIVHNISLYLCEKHEEPISPDMILEWFELSFEHSHLNFSAAPKFSREVPPMWAISLYDEINELANGD